MDWAGINLMALGAIFIKHPREKLMLRENFGTD